MSATAVRGDATLGLGFKLLSHLGLAEAHAHAPSVLVNELYTTGFKAAPHHFKR